MNDTVMTWSGFVLMVIGTAGWSWQAACVLAGVLLFVAGARRAAVASAPPVVPTNEERA